MKGIQINVRKCLSLDVLTQASLVILNEVQEAHQLLDCLYALVT